MASDNFTPKHPSRSQTLQSFDIETQWQGPCRGCHHHHYSQAINIHVSRDRSIQKKDLCCENCRKLLFCLGQPTTRLSLLSQNTDLGDRGDLSQATSSGRRACFSTPPDDHILGQRNHSRRSIDRSSSQSARGEDHSSFQPNQPFIPDQHTENSEDTIYSTAAKIADQDTAMQSPPATSTPQDNRRIRGLRRFTRRIASLIQLPLQRVFHRSRPRHPVYSIEADPPLRRPSINSVGSLARPAEPVSTPDNTIPQGIPILTSDDQPLFIDGDHTDADNVAERERISQIRHEKTEIARSREVTCRCELDCDCRNHDHDSQFGSGGYSDMSMNVHTNSSILSISNSNLGTISRDSRDFGYIGAWTQTGQQSTERRTESRSTYRQSSTTVSSTTTAAMSHDALELPEPPPRVPSPLMNPSSRLLNTPSQSRTRLRLSTDLSAGRLEPVGEASSTSETSQTQRHAFDHVVIQPTQTNQGPINESSREHEFNQRELMDQNRLSILPDSSERNSSPRSFPGSDLPRFPHLKRSKSV